MRDAQHGVEPLDGPMPAAVIQDLPVGVLEVDERRCVVQANQALLRLLPPGPVGGRAGDRVVDCWPALSDATAAVLRGRTVDTLLVTQHSALRIRGVPRVTGTTVRGGLLVLSEAEGDARRSDVVDVRDRRLPLVADGDAPGDPEIATARTGPSRNTVLVWRRTPTFPDPLPDQGQTPDRPGTGARATGRMLPRAIPRTPGRRREAAGRADQHAATHDPVTGLPNTVLLRQCLSDALATCHPGKRVGVLTVELSGAGGAGLRSVGERLTQLVGARDIVGRLRGDRFAVVLPQLRANTDLEAFLSKVAARVRGGKGRVSCSGRPVAPDRLGMVFVDPVHGGEQDRDPHVVLALALEALERSRGSGHPVVAQESYDDAERARAVALRSYDIHDSSLDEVFQSVSMLAARSCEAFAGLVTFVDENLQWVRAMSCTDLRGGVDGHGPRHLALCDRTIRGRGVLVVRDTDKDPDYRASRHVGWQLGMRFYAGAPLITPEGRAIGTLCVLDPLPRGLTERQRHSLTSLAAETITLLEKYRAHG
jgi:GGDEF domain-containing protein